MSNRFLMNIDDSLHNEKQNLLNTNDITKREIMKNMENCGTNNDISGKNNPSTTVNNDNNSNNKSDNNSAGSDSQLGTQKFPPEMQYARSQQQRTLQPSPLAQTSLRGHQQQKQQNEENQPATLIIAATTLNATTMKAALPGANTIAVDTSSLQSTEFKGPKLWRHWVQQWPIISQPLAIFIILLALWILFYIRLPEYAAPESVIMRIVFLFIGAHFVGILTTFLGLPDMLGMLSFGILYTNLGWADFSGYQALEAFLREMALINIMLLAGLGLDWKSFKKLWLMILRLALVPTIAEVVAIALLARFLLSMPWLWGILLGLVITAVSPNVVVTVMLKLKEERLGLNNGIHTLIYAMTTCNDVVAIFVFGVFLGVIFSTGTLTDQILQGPIGIVIGIVYGYMYGLMLQYIPSKEAVYVNGLRFILTMLGGTIAVMGSRGIGYPSAGALGCVTVAFIAGIGWKRSPQAPLSTGREVFSDEKFDVVARLDLLWKFLKPVSFALIGKEINFAILDGRVVGYGLLVVLIGSLFRLVFAYVSTCGGGLSRWERAYITISGFPKATVQAALGPVALDLARSLSITAANDGGDSDKYDHNLLDENLIMANSVLIISVLSIICTAPIGAILMLRLAPRWLKRSPLNANEANSPSFGNADEMNKTYNDDVMTSFRTTTQSFNNPDNKSHNFDQISIAAAGSSTCAPGTISHLAVDKTEARLDGIEKGVGVSPLPHSPVA